MFWVYILESQEKPSWYIGYTSNLRRRLGEHNNKNGGLTTSRAKKWKCIYCEGYINKSDAQGRERFLKSGSGRKFLKKQLSNYLQLSTKPCG